MPDIDQRQQGKDRRHDHAERAVRTGKNGLAARIAFVALICHTPQLTKILMPSNGRGKFLYPAFARAAHLWSASDLSMKVPTGERTWAMPTHILLFWGNRLRSTRPQI